MRGCPSERASERVYAPRPRGIEIYALRAHCDNLLTYGVSRAHFNLRSGLSLGRETHEQLREWLSCVYVYIFNDLYGYVAREVRFQFHSRGTRGGCLLSPRE